MINISESLLNGVVLKNDWVAAMAALNKPPMSNSTIGVFVVCAFIFGIILIWLYAAIRPRFGPGPKTAFIAAFVTWLIGYFFPNISLWAMDLVPSKLVWWPVGWGFLEVVLAALIGGWFYKET